MSLIPKIMRLTKLPALLKHRQEAEEESKNKREQARKQQLPFVLDDESRRKLTHLPEYQTKRGQLEQTASPKSDDENVGKRIDVTI